MQLKVHYTGHLMHIELWQLCSYIQKSKACVNQAVVLQEFFLYIIYLTGKLKIVINSAQLCK